MTDDKTSDAEAGESRSPDEIRADIEATREDLGDTVEALAGKTDVKAKAQDKIAEARRKLTGAKDDLMGKGREASPETAKSAASQASQKARENPLPVAVAGASLIGFALGRWSKG
jgi:ElaB/YqjD/DUF883 family membrane-anchored ribosome-binding protein